jgi:hypothetical protein
MADDQGAPTPAPPAREPSPAALSFITTEHFNLATARGNATMETNGRASLFLSSVSAGLVAFAFAGQVSRSALYTFGLVLFPVLFFLGLTSFSRALQASVADTLYVLRINRVRRYYLEHAPELAGYLAPAAPGDDLGDLLRQEGYRPGLFQTLLSVPGTISVLNGVLLGAAVGLAVAALTVDNLWFGTLAGIATMVVTVLAHQRYQSRIRTTKPDPFAA